MKISTRLTIGLAILAVLSTIFVIAPGAASAASPPATPPSGSTFDARVAQRKAERETKLDDKETKRYVEKCVNAQNKIRPLYQAVTKTIDGRNKAYQSVDAKLWVTIGRLKLAGKDTFELEKQRTNLADKMNDFQTTGSNYTQTLDDIQVINCKADPTGFKALLDTARIYRQQVVDKSTAIRDYIVNDIKKTLTIHTSELQPKAEGNN